MYVRVGVCSEGERDLITFNSSKVFSNYFLIFSFHFLLLAQ